MSPADQVEAKVREMRALITDQTGIALLQKSQLLLQAWAEAGDATEGVALQVAALCSMAAEREMLKSAM